MKLRELIKGVTVLDNAFAFAGATRKWGEEPEIYIGIRDSQLNSLYSANLTREDAQKLVRELTAALEVRAHTEEEIANHEDHVQFWREKNNG